jgi:ubiquinol-cytochrome c reductase cytochrome c subunit
VIARASLAAVLACLALAGPAAGQPPQGIVRPSDEAGLSLRQLGEQLYAGNCSSCHGIDGRGISSPSPRGGAGNIAGQGPSLRGVGELAADFYLRLGYMPLGNATEQPMRRRPPFSDREIRALVDYVGSLGGGPAIPRPDPAAGSLSEGLTLFTEHCAGCHQVAAQGGVAPGARIPPLEDATATQVAQAVRVGPYVMPRFSKTDISDAQLNSIVRYVKFSQRPDNRGGWAIGNVGPVPEGIVTWFIAATLFVAFCVVIGTRLRS